MNADPSIGPLSRAIDATDSVSFAVPARAGSAVGDLKDNRRASREAASRQPRSNTMLPSPVLLPSVLPTERLLESGKPRPEVRAQLRRIPDLRNAATILGAYLQWIGLLGAAAMVPRVVVWVVVFVLMVRIFGLLGVLGHEAVHGLLFTNPRINRWVGRWLLAYPILLPFDLYQRAHLNHHRDELGPNDVDLNVYDACPMEPSSFGRKLLRDLCLVSGWKVLRSLLRDLRNRKAEIRRILVVQAALLAGFALIGHPEFYVLLWLLPWMTLWRLVTRLRLIAEHGGLTRSKDRRLTTHHIRQGLLPRFWMVPYNIGWHLAHHVDMGVPFRNLPALHGELVASGWITPGLEHKNYFTLWRSAVRSELQETLVEE
ncbi:MAG: fatty acid desaturase [Actinobacteria bacterium]|nr:fatty acid desaturase [Actinomycetota bacterium]